MSVDHRCVLMCVLLGQVLQTQEKISRLEQEKEHWLLEAQLGQVRLEKENQRIAQLEAQVAWAGDGRQSHSGAESSDAAQADCTDLLQDTSVVRTNASKI